ncbi:NADH-quinone oxidoreductase subunit C [Streptomyces sp. NPDC051909]|uniref:NADH-quinone oxidoreductase subunit C n=1 Tax=Streptomyces sp. NPDC051909 TaxID=3154944 RepID=UPI0034168BEE
MSENFADSYATLPDAVAEVFGEEATAERAYDLLTVDVPVGSWIAALEIARDKLGLTYFDWLSAVDEPGVGFRVCAHVASVGPGGVRRLLVRTTVPHAAASLPSAVAVYAGAAWHERETHEMFGVTFTDHPHLVHLLLPDTFEGHPLRKDFVLAARVAKAWPGAKEPGESHDPNAPKRRQMLPPGVPDPNDWGPLKGQLPPAPSRPSRAAAATGDRPARRTRTAGEGSVSQPPTAPQAPEAPASGPRRTRSASAGSASQRAEAATAAPATGTPTSGPRRSRTASGGSASQRAEGPETAAPAEGGAPSERAEASPRTRGSDAPWHHARPAFDEEPPAPEPEAPSTPAAPAEGEPTSEAAPAQGAPAPDAPPAEGDTGTGDTPPTPTPDPDPAGGDPA